VRRARVMYIAGQVRGIRVSVSAVFLAIAIAGAGTIAPVALGSGGWVAKVGETEIKTTSFNHWSEVAYRNQDRAAPNEVIPVHTPPDFKECVARKIARGAKLKKKVTRAAAKSACRREFDLVKGTVMELLITSAWIDGQASAMGIEITDEQVNKELAETKKQAFPTEKGYQDFLKSSGETEADVKGRIKVDLQSQAIRDQIVNSVAAPTSEEVEAYFKKHRNRFTPPEERDFRYILAWSRARALAAKVALKAGRTWKGVARKYSVDRSTRRSGGLVTGAVEGSLDPQLERRLFSSRLKEIRGPVRGSFGYYVFAVVKIRPPVIPTLAQVRSEVIEQIKSERESTALQRFVEAFQKEWTAKTICRKAFAIDLCSRAV